MQETKDLRIIDFAQIGDNQLQVDLYGGESNACGCVTFTFTSSDALDRHAIAVKGWMTGDIPVTLVTSDNEIKLTIYNGQ